MAHEEVKIGDKGFVRCFKPTSNKEYYQGNAARLSGVVAYKGGELPFFPKDTFIPVDFYHVPCWRIHISIGNGTFEHKGEMPADFHAKMIAAIQGNVGWQKKRKNEVLEWFAMP